MGREDPTFFVVGQINKPHGTKGELFVWPLTDHPEGIYAPGVVFRSSGPSGNAPDPDLPPLRIETIRSFRAGFLVCFGGVDTRNEAESLRNRYLYVPADDIAPLAEGEVFYHQLLGMTVVTVDGRTLGPVSEVFELSPSDILEVHGGGKQYMIPFTKEIIVEVDIDGDRLVIDPPDGLLDL